MPTNDIAIPVHLLRRFGIGVVIADQDSAVVETSMPLAGMRNPFTHLPTIAPLGVLIDAVSGMCRPRSALPPSSHPDAP
ncbi:hypothetical protein [Mycobacterium sp. 4858]|uniref:hypothetical protein n=1 Tax=Mycobacterium sp. 4858 TaxID=2057185 RepID=UPI000C8599F8|nr:hypothetical protein [Mycobacterium sp. 4858]